MKRCLIIVSLALCVTAAGCLMEPDEDAVAGEDEDLSASASELSWPKKKKKPKPPAPQPPPPPAPAPPPPAPAPPPPAPNGVPGFLDACLMPGMTKATFNATSTFDAHDEGATSALTLPFSFSFYGTPHTKYWFTTNGQLGFGNTVGGSAFGQTTCPLPQARFTTPIVLVYSADLINRLEPHAGVCYAVTGTAPNRKLVVTWKDSFFYEAWLTSNVTFSAVLSESTNAIDVQIDRVSSPGQPAYEAGYGAALGKQSGSSGQTYSCYTGIAPGGTVVHYNP